MKKLEKVKTPCSISFYSHIADMAGCGNIRIIYPYMLLNTYFSKTYQFNAFYSDRYVMDQRLYNSKNFICFQRSATKDQKTIVDYCIKTNPGKCIVYEIDDNLLDIPEWNFASGFYRENTDHIKEILEMVPCMTVSTVPLKKVMDKYCDNISVISNHLPKFIWGEPEDRTKETKRVRILYAGSYNHFDQSGNGGDFPKELVKFIIDTASKYKWIFVGGIPKELRENSKIEHHEWKSIHELPSFLKSLNVDIALAPLEDNIFNRCKSNIKALESVALGVPLVSSAIPDGPYNNLKGNCETTIFFIHTIELLANNTDLRSKYWQDQYNTLKSRLFWEDNDNLLKYVNSHLRFLGKKL